jgi:hypothetical protein
MNYQKLDAALIAALEDMPESSARRWQVFVHTTRAPADEEAFLLERIGVTGSAGARRIFTATVSASDVAELSQQPWVQYMRLSRELDLKPGDEALSGEDGV